MSLGVRAAFAAPGPAKNPPAVFIDCEWCDLDFIKTEIPFVNYVIDRAVADVHVLITTQVTGSGGTEYTINFIGQQSFAGMSDTLVYVSAQGDADDTVRRGLVKVLKLGLVRYVAHTSAADKLMIGCERKQAPTPAADRWNNWVFSISGSGYFSSQQSTGYNSLYGQISANRTTEALKTWLSLYYSYNSNFFVINDSMISPPPTKSYGASASIVSSLGSHWSVGGFSSAYSSTYSNVFGEASFGPALEFDVFPYSQSTRRMLTVYYHVGYSYNRYYETTIYDKLTENLFNQSLSVTIQETQPWGSVSTTVAGAHYFHDVTKYHLSINPTISLHVVKGLNLTINGYAARIHDQLSLSKQGLTPDEILLRIKQLKTQYEYYGSVGLTYSFGSLFSNVVNPRM